MSVKEPWDSAGKQIVGQKIKGWTAEYSLIVNQQHQKALMATLGN